MRVLCVGNMYPPHSQGGYEIVWRSAVEHLRRSGHDVRVLTTDYRAPGVDADVEEEGVRRDLRWYWRDHAFPRRGPLARLSMERHNAAVIDRELRASTPDAVAWWAMGGMSLSIIARVSRAGIPSVGVVADDWMVYGPHVDAWSRSFADRPRLAAVVERLTAIPTRFRPPEETRWLFISDAVRQASVLAGHRLPGAEIAHWGVDRELFPRAQEQPWAWRLLCVGRIDPRKGLDTAVRALALLPGEARLRIVGGGDDAHRDELRELARELGVDERVRIGPLPRESLHVAYAQADAVLFPVRWEEPWGLVPLEAMSVGRPVVATATGGSSEYLEHERNCLVFRPVDDPSQLAAAIVRLERDPDLRARLREGGFATAARFTEARFHRALERALERVAAR